MKATKIRQHFESDYTVQATSSETGLPLDLTNFDEAKFVMQNQETGETPVNYEDAVILDPETGDLSYTFKEPETATLGTYSAFFALYKDGKKKLSVPSDENLIIEIVDDLVTDPVIPPS